jgi:hypothetical protein
MFRRLRDLAADSTAEPRHRNEGTNDELSEVVGSGVDAGPGPLTAKLGPLRCNTITYL